MDYPRYLRLKMIKRQVAIENFTMPQSCASCDILQWGSLDHYCPLAKNYDNTSKVKKGRMKGCPLKEIVT